MRLPSVSELSITKQGLILIALPCVLQVAFLVVLVLSNIRVSGAQYWAMHSKEVIARTEGLYRRLVEAHGAVRGLLLTDSEVFRDQVGKSLGGIEGDIEALRGAVDDSQTQFERVGRIKDRAVALIGWQKDVVDMHAAGRRDEALAQVRNFSGKRKLDELRGEVDEFLREESRLDGLRFNSLGRAGNQQVVALVLGGLSALGLTVVLAAAIGRGLATRFGVLNDNVARLTEGKELCRPLEGRDELAQLDRVFRGMARAIAEKNRENEMFIYSVSHDLRSPLVNLQGFSQELGHAANELRGLVDHESVPESARKQALSVIELDVNGSIHYIQTAVSRLSAIIDALLRLSRVGRVEYRWQRVDLDATVARVVEALNSTIQGRGATVEVGPLPAAWGDPTAVEQIFANLIGNAVNYLDPARPGVVRVGCSGTSPSGVNAYYVEDNGRGIPAAGLSKLFLAFQRFHDGAANGEGIGLALVRRIIERHAGTIRVESTEGVGSTFRVELPGRAPEAESGPQVRKVGDEGGPFA